MSGLTLEEANKWREKAIQIFYDYPEIQCYNPCKNVIWSDFNNYRKEEYITKNIHHVRRSDLILVKLDKKISIGSLQEIFLAKELQIPIVAFIEDGNEYWEHPYLEWAISKFCNSVESACQFIVENYIETIF